MARRPIQMSDAETYKSYRDAVGMDRRLIEKRIFQSNYKIVKGYLISRFELDPMAADEFAQIGFSVLFERLAKGSYQERGVKFRTFVIQVAINAYKMELRKQSKTILLSQDVPPMDATELAFQMGYLDEKYPERPRVLAILNKWKSTGNDCYGLLDDFYFRGLGHEEIAREMNITKENARKKKSRCLEKLKQELAKLRKNEK